MRRVYIVLELRDDSNFDPLREDHQDELAEDALTAGERVDRLLLRAHIVRRCSPLLNVIEPGSQQFQTQGADAGQRRQA